MPRADDFPAFISELVEIPAKTNPLGIKGIGEAGTIAAPPTVVNAVLDALRELGVEHLDMPLTPDAHLAGRNARSASENRKLGLHDHMPLRRTAGRSTPKPLIREHKIPTPDSKPYIAVEGPDGNLWFCENGASKIGCFDPNRHVPRICSASGRQHPVGIAVGGDGNLWFTEKQGNRVGRITLDGAIAEFAMPNPKPAPTELCSGRTAMSGSRRVRPIDRA